MRERKERHLNYFVPVSKKNSAPFQGLEKLTAEYAPFFPILNMYRKR
jgi:hypothetical protein